MPRSQPVAVKIIQRLRDIGVELPEDAVAVSMRPKPHERANGAWSWWVLTATGEIPTVNGQPSPVGSQATMTQLVRAPRLAMYQEPWNDRVIDIDSTGE